MRNLHILFLTPFWLWLDVLFCTEYFKRFPYEKRNDVKDWICEVMTVHYWGRVDVVKSFSYNGKLKNAYIKARVAAFRTSFRYDPRVYGIEYGVKGKKDECS